MSIDLYGEIGQQLEAAFAAFRQHHEQMYPMPDKPAKQARRDWMMRVLLFVVVIAGMLVSGSRTIVIFAIGKTMVIGGAGVVMLEGAAVVMSFYHTREKYRNRDVDSNYITRYLRAGSLFAVIVMCAGNTQDVLQIDGFATGNLWVALSLPIAISVALAAPVMVFISGHVLALLSVLDMTADKRAEMEYEAKLKEWNDGLLRRWNANKNAWNANVNIHVDKPSVSVLPVSVQTDSRQTGAGYSRVSTAVQTAKTWLVANPDKWDLPVRELADIIGVGKDSVAKARNELQR